MSTYEDILSSGMALLHLGNNAEGALLRFEKAKPLAPEGRCEAWVNAAIVLDALGRPTEAIEQLQEAVERDPDHLVARENLAFIAGRDDVEAGLQAWAQVLQRWPERANAWANQGTLLERIGEPERAAAAYERALALDPGLDVVREALERLRA